MGDLFEQGQIRTHQVTGAAAAGGIMNVGFQPPVGELWEILYADVFHDDAAGPVGSWRFTDGILLIQIRDGAALAANIRLSLYSAEFPRWCYLGHGNVLDYNVGAGATNGCLATMNIVGRKLVGLL